MSFPLNSEDLLYFILFFVLSNYIYDIPVFYHLSNGSTNTSECYLSGKYSVIVVYMDISKIPE